MRVVETLALLRLSYNNNNNYYYYTWYKIIIGTLIAVGKT